MTFFRAAGEFFVTPVKIENLTVLADSAQLKGRRPNQEDRYTTIVDMNDMLREAGCVGVPLPAVRHS